MCGVRHPLFPVTHLYAPRVWGWGLYVVGGGCPGDVVWVLGLFANICEGSVRSNFNSKGAFLEI